MYEKQKDRIKKSVDINVSVATRITDIKDKKHISFSTIVNETMNKTICLDCETKKRMISVMEKEIALINNELAQFDKKDVFWKDSCMRQLKIFEEFVQLLNL